MMQMLMMRTVRYLRSIGHSRGFGIQSPFAYRLVTAVLCRDGGGAGNRWQRLRQRVASYADGRGMRLVELDLEAQADVETVLSSADEACVLLCHRLYATPSARSRWEQIKADSRSGVSFDLGRAGVVFFDLSMYKQHYLLNL